jgi:hypothetical protein
MSSTRAGTRLAIALGAALCASAVRAQQPQAAPGEPAIAPESNPPLAPGARLTDAEVEARYHGAFEALARGERDAAVQLLQSIVEAAPEHSLAEHARKLLSDLAATAPPAQRPSSWLPEEDRAPPSAAPRAPHAQAQHPTSTARAELVFFQTLHGIALGAEFCALIACNGAQPWVLSMMAGAGAGFAASWHFSRSGVTPGLSRSLTDGVLWGAANGIGLALALGDTDRATSTAAFLAGGQLIGLGLAGLLYDRFEPTAGQVSLTASGGLWSLAVAAQFVGALDGHYGSRTWAWVLLGTGNAGVLAGAMLARSVPMTTSRVLLIDAGGLLGTLTGLGVAVLAQGNDIQPTPTLIPGLIGTLTGLSIAYSLTSDWDTVDRTAAQLHLGVMPVPSGAAASLGGWF